MLDRLFPEQYRAFGRGELSLVVERFGGIDSLYLIDVRECNGHLYPDRYPLKWLQKGGGESGGRPVFSPGIQFRHGNELYFPVDAQLYPFGFTSENYSLVTGHKSITIKFAPHEGEVFSLMLSTLHLPSGTCKTLKNQLTRFESNVQILPPELRGADFNASYPFSEDVVVVKRREAVLQDNALILCAECYYNSYVKHQYWVIQSSIPVEKKALTNVIMLSGTMDSQPVEIGFGFGETLEEAMENAGVPYERQFDDAMELCHAPTKVNIAGFPEASTFFEMMPGYQRHLRLTESITEVSSRAAMHKYGFFAMWDHIYPSRDFLLLGECDITRKMLRYLIHYPWIHTFPWASMQLIIQANEYFAYVDDSVFLREIYPQFQKFFEFNSRFVNSDNGLIATSCNCGVDVSKEIGIDGLFYASCLNGWWYDSLRCLENMALALNDQSTALRCAAFITKLEQHYENAFFDVENGYLRASIKQDGTLPDVTIFQNTHTLGVDYIHGFYLMRNIMKQLATYQATKLYHPMGHTAVAPDSEIPCDMWKTVHMNQHLGHECKVARLGGRPEEALRVMKGYMEYFTKYKCAVETFNLAGCPGDTSQLAQWQAFSATGAAQAIFTGVAGWTKHRGGWTWLPSSGPESVIEMPNIKLTVSGDGGFADGLMDGEDKLLGTLQLPSDVRTRDLRVVRTNELPVHPVLLMAIDAQISNVTVDAGLLSFVVGNMVHAPVKVYAPSKPVVTINGEEHATEWNPEDKILWFDAIFEPGNEVKIISI